MDINRKQMIWACLVAGSLFGLAELHASDRSKVGVARISSARQAPKQYNTSHGILRTRYEDAGVVNPIAPTTTSSTSSSDNEAVIYEDDCCDYGCRGRFCHTTPWWLGSRQVGLFRWLLCDGYCTVAPGHGWAAPYKVPVRRIPVGYQRYYADPQSQAAAGQARHPIIYTPTDTTQLGYYYQKVPMWRDQPHMYPPTPWPANFHYRYCPRGGNCRFGGETVIQESVEPVPAETAPPAEPAAPGEKVTFSY